MGTCWLYCCKSDLYSDEKRILLMSNDTQYGRLPKMIEEVSKTPSPDPPPHPIFLFVGDNANSN